MRVPSLLGAIVAKAAASTEIASLDRRERHKHLGDLAFLVGVAADHADVESLQAALTKGDRRRLRRAAELLIDHAWESRDQERIVAALLSEWLA